MKKPFLQKSLHGSKSVIIFFYDESSHYDCLYQAINGLVEAGFASEKEIIEEWFNLLQYELKK